MSLKLSDLIPASTLERAIENAIQDMVSQLASAEVNLVIDVTDRERIACDVEGCEETFKNRAGWGGHRRHVHGLPATP